MAISSAFLTTCRASIVLTTEYTDYAAALNVFDAASEPDKLAKWLLLNGDSQTGGSMAMRLRVAIREVVRNQDLADLSTLEREEVVRTLSGMYLRSDDKPQTEAEKFVVLSELAQAGVAN